MQSLDEFNRTYDVSEFNSFNNSPLAASEFDDFDNSPLTVHELIVAAIFLVVGFCIFVLYFFF